MARKRVTIVFEETEKTTLHEGAGEQGFHLFIEGAERTKTLPEEAWSASEFWGMKCFAIVAKIIQESGGMRSIGRKGGS
jgi:hypothetical protein